MSISRTNCKLLSCLLRDPRKVLLTTCSTSCDDQLSLSRSLIILHRRWVKYGCPPVHSNTYLSNCCLSNFCAGSIFAPNPSAKGSAFSKVKSVKSTRCPILKGVLLPSRIKSPGVATPINTKESL